MNIDSKQRTQLAVALGAIVVLVAGYSAFGKTDPVSDKTAQRGPMGQMGGPPGQMQQDGASGATGAMGRPGGPGGPGGHGGPGGQSGPGGGQMPQQVTGAAATKAKDAAEKAVDGEARGVMQARSGDGYVVIVETDDGPVIVELSKSFKVTGKHEMNGRGDHDGPPPGGQGGPPQQQGDDVQ